MKVLVACEESQRVCAADAARAIGKDDKSNICAAARKGRRAYGYYWRYKIDI